MDLEFVRLTVSILHLLLHSAPRGELGRRDRMDAIVPHKLDAGSGFEISSGALKAENASLRLPGKLKRRTLQQMASHDLPFPLCYEQA